MSLSKLRILMPYAESYGEANAPLAPRLDNLGGKVIGLIANGWRSLDFTYEEFRRILWERYEIAEIIDRRKPASSPLPTTDLNFLANNADAVISALGN